MDKQKDDCEARTLLVLAIGVGFGVVIGAAFYAAAFPMFQSEKWAAWVQAIGSIGAILAAIWIASRQTDRERTVARDSAKVRLIFCEGAIYELHTALWFAAKSARIVGDLLSDPATRASPVLESSMGFVGENLDRISSLSARIEWEAFLIAMPEKAEFVRKTITGLSYFGKISNTRGIAADEYDRERVYQLLFNFEALLENQDFLTLSAN